MGQLPHLQRRFLPTATLFGARHGSARHMNERQHTRVGRGALACGTLVVWLTSTAACDSGDPADEPPTFTEVHERVLQTGCVFATCHQAGASSAGMMSLERDEAHANLVDVPAAAAPGKIRVVPGDPDASYVIEKLTNAMPTAGEQMPPDAPLEDDRVELVRAWIEAGAADD